MVVQDEPRREDGDGARSRAIAHLSLEFVLDAATTGMAGLPTLDAILVMAVNQANIAPLTRDPAARGRYGALDSPAPDEERRPVSISAVAASLALPYETARRRLGRLADRGVCVLSEAGATIPQSFLGSDAYLGTTRALHERAWRFYREARAQDVVGRLPASNYPTGGGVPIRGAARILADYLLRSSEIFIGWFGDLVSSLVGMGLVQVATGPDPRLASQPQSIAALATRLGLPAETVRRRVTAMAARGVCARADHGVTLSTDVMEGEPFAALLGDNAANVNRLFAGLAERGVIDAWETLRPTGRAAAVATRLAPGDR